MKLRNSIAAALLGLLHVVSAASSWSFDDASLTVQGKGDGIGGGIKQKLSATTPLTSSAVSLGPADSLKIILTTQDGKAGKKPHQAFLQLEDAVTGLEDSYAFSIKENGKGKVELTQKQLPHQFLTSSKPIRASIIIGSYGSSTPYNHHVFDLTIAAHSNTPVTVPSPPERYGSKPQINHNFKSDPKSPPRIISLVFTLAVLAALPALFGAWLLLGANVDHFGKALGTTPVAHGLFFGSVVAMEGVFYMYYVSWTLFQALPAAAVVGAVAYISGSRALTEVQERRFAGER